MPTIVFPAPGFTTSTQFLSPFSSFDVYPSAGGIFTNQLLYSQNFTTTNWISNNTTAAVDTLGTGTIITLYSTTSSIGQTVAVSSGSSYILSFYAKLGSIATVNYAVTNASDGSAIVSTASYSDSLLLNTWTRISTVFTATTASITVYPALATSTTGTTYLFGVQLEQNTTATNYQTTIDTTPAAKGSFTAPAISYTVVSKIKDAFVIRGLPNTSYVFDSAQLQKQVEVIKSVDRVFVSTSTIMVTSSRAIVTPTLFINAVPSGSIAFNGTADYLNASGANSYLTTGQFTIEVWVFPTVLGRNIVNNHAWNTGQNAGWIVAINSNGTISMSASAGVFNTQPNVLTSTGTILANSWSHVAITRDSGNTIRIFINGNIAGSVSYATSLNLNSGTSLAGTRIGVAVWDGAPSSYFSGYMSNLRIVSGIAVYTTAFSPAAPFIAISGTALLLNNSVPGPITDSSINAYPITVFNGAAFSVNSPYLSSALLQISYIDTSSMQAITSYPTPVIAKFKVPVTNSAVFSMPAIAKLKDAFVIRGLPNTSYVFDAAQLQKQIAKIKGLPNTSYVFDAAPLQKQLEVIRGIPVDRYLATPGKLKGSAVLRDSSSVIIIGQVVKLKSGSVGTGMADPSFMKKAPIQFWN